MIGDWGAKGLAFGGARLPKDLRPLPGGCDRSIPPVANRPISVPSRGSMRSLDRERWHIRDNGSAGFWPIAASGFESSETLLIPSGRSGASPYQSPITNYQSLITFPTSLRQSVCRHHARLRYAPFARTDSAPIFQRQQTDAHDNELTGNKA